jgi:hypothetical protein
MYRRTAEIVMSTRWGESIAIIYFPPRIEPRTSLYHLSHTPSSPQTLHPSACPSEVAGIIGMHHYTQLQYLNNSY